MARLANLLTARAVATLSEPGRHADGNGLFLAISANGARSWVFMWKVAGRRREMGLGSVADVTLAQARALATDARRQVADGRDPIAERARARARAKGIPTFGEFADGLIADIASGFRNPTHRDQWRSTLGTVAMDLKRMTGDAKANAAYRKALAAMRAKPVDKVDTFDVLAVLKPLWGAKTETGSRVRGRIERVLDAAKAQDLREGENPARWRGHLKEILPARNKLARGHHAAMAFDEVPEFMVALRALPGLSPVALQFTILTAARTSEVLGMRWEEVDLGARVWTAPARRMKAGREHRVPLSAHAVAILERMASVRTGPFVFPGMREGRALSSMSMQKVLQRMGRRDITVHGFRSSFRDFAGERTHFPREVAEAALAHVVGDATERAYRRGDALEKRRGLMDAWAAWCEPRADNVVPLVRAV